MTEELVQKPLVMAHRGGAGLRPENTMAAFNHAIALGVDGIEIDVHLSADGQVVVYHDYALKPAITRKEGAWLKETGPRIKDLTYKQLLGYDVGALDPASDYARRFPEQVAHDGEKILLLEDVIARLQESDAARCQLLIEIKSEALDPSLSADPLVLADAVVSRLQKTGFVERAALIAFNWHVLLRAQEKEPALRTGYLTLPAYAFGRGPVPPGSDAPPQEYIDLLCSYDERPAPWAAGLDPFKFEGSVFRAIAAAGGQYWGPFYGDVDAGAVDAAKAQGLGVSVWAPNTYEDLHIMVKAGVDLIATDRPDYLLELLGRSAAAPHENA